MFSSDVDFPRSLWVKSRQHSAKAAATYAVIPLIICLGPGLESNKRLATSLYKSAKPANLCLVHFDCKLRSFVDAAVASLQIYKPNDWPSIIWGHDAIKFILHSRPCSCIIRRRVLDMLFKFIQKILKLVLDASWCFLRLSCSMTTKVLFQQEFFHAGLSWIKNRFPTTANGMQQNACIPILHSHSQVAAKKAKKSVVEEDLWHTKNTISLQFWERRSNTWRQTMARLKLQTLQELDWSTSMKRPDFGASNGLGVFSRGLASCVLNQCSLPPLHWQIFKRAKINSTQSKQNAKELAQGRANWCQRSVWFGWSR